MLVIGVRRLNALSDIDTRYTMIDVFCFVFLRDHPACGRVDWCHGSAWGRPGGVLPAGACERDDRGGPCSA